MWQMNRMEINGIILLGKCSFVSLNSYNNVVSHYSGQLYTGVHQHRFILDTFFHHEQQLLLATSK